MSKRNGRGQKRQGARANLELVLSLVGLVGALALLLFIGKMALDRFQAPETPAAATQPPIVEAPAAGGAVRGKSVNPGVLKKKRDLPEKRVVI